MPLIAELSTSDAVTDARNPDRLMRIGIVDCNVAKYACGRAYGGIKSYPHIVHTTNGGGSWGHYKAEMSIQGMHTRFSPLRHLAHLHPVVDG